MHLHLPTLAPVTTPRLSARPLRADDAEALRVLTDRPAITAAVHFLNSPFTLADARSLIDGAGDGRDCFWGVWSPPAPEMIGTVGTHLRGDEAIEIGYWFAPAVHGQGYATEAVHAILRRLQESCPARRIYAECRPENRASWRLLERLGFCHQGAAGERPGRLRLVYGAGTAMAEAP